VGPPSGSRARASADGSCGSGTRRS
jgi:hypothetical protein